MSSKGVGGGGNKANKNGKHPSPPKEKTHSIDLFIRKFLENQKFQGKYLISLAEVAKKEALQT
jgi:hypothetical protein